MYTSEHIEITYQRASGITALSAQHKELLLKAREASWKAYAPYSKFKVGAAALLEGGEIVLASNKENASFPAGICAERNLMGYVSDQFPEDKIIAVAIAANPDEFQLDKPVTPCGICRQVMCETERNQKLEFEIILAGQTGDVLIFPSAAGLLPFQFHMSELKK